MSEIYQERNFENEVPNLKGTLNPDEIENNNKISSSSNNSIVIHSEKVSNVENVEKNIKTEKSSSNLIGSNCNYANNSNKGSNMYNLYSKKNSVVDNQSLNQNQNFNENLSLNQNQNFNENLSLNQNQNFNENQNINENLSLIESNQTLDESNQSLNENNQNENETVGNENKKEIIQIKNDIKKSLEDFSNKLINEKKGDFISNGFRKIKVINNKNKDISITKNENKLKIEFNYKKDFNGNYKWKFISIDNFNLNKETIEKYSLNLIEKKCVYSLNENNLIEINFELNDNSKKFLIFAIGLYDNNNILFTNTIILFFINLKNCKK